MRHEFAIHALLVPGLLLVLFACIPVFIVVDLALARIGVYGCVWHPALFRASLFVVLFCVAGWATR